MMREINLLQQNIQKCCDFLSVCMSNSNSSKEKELYSEVIKYLINKKYGLVFEEYREETEVVLENKRPVLQEIESKKVENGIDLDCNLLIEGENLHSLMLLRDDYKKCVDIVYIDPPYNTGNSYFLYNDKKISLDGQYKHSRWLSFMSKRLVVAKELMKDDGVLFISIGNDELAQLKLLCDDMFGEDNCISIVSWKRHSGGKNDSKYLSNDVEYVLIYAINKELICFNKKSCVTDGTYKLQDEYVERRGNYKLNKLDRASLLYSKNLDYEIKAPDGTLIYPGGDKEKYEIRKAGGYTRKDWNWRWSKEKLEWGIQNGYIVFKHDAKKDVWTVYYKQYEYVDNKDVCKKREIPYSNYIDFVDTSKGTSELTDVIGVNRFAYPKSVDLLKYLLSLHRNKNALVLDFFAGSGTTGQAVLELNKEDGGTRRFILCTNNEEHICEDIAYERLRTVITGIRKDGSKYSDGIFANLKYYKCMVGEGDE